MAKTVLQKEIDRLRRAERRFLRKQLRREPTKLDLLLEDKVPEKLEATLDAAFSKAFHFIFAKGSSIISKTFSTDKLIEEFEADTASLEEIGGRKQMRKFSRRAAATGTAHTLVSTVTGTALGFAGGMIPGILAFITLLLRNIYQISMKYGYSFDTEEEQKFILSVITAAVLDGDDMIRANKDVNRLIREGLSSDDSTVDERIKEAAVALAHALLLMKFLQNIPVVGAIGGASDFIYMERISDYAVLKYQRRFLVDQLRSGRE
jgi:hypothetical protein